MPSPLVVVCFCCGCVSALGEECDGVNCIIITLSRKRLAVAMLDSCSFLTLFHAWLEIVRTRSETLLGDFLPP